MPIIQFLAAYARLFLDRAAREYPALVNEVNIRYYEDEDGLACVSLHRGTVFGIEISVPHRLGDVLEQQWHPVLEQDQWELFVNNVTGYTPEDHVTAECRCGARGEVNYDVGGPDEAYYCNGGPGCTP